LDSVTKPLTDWLYYCGEETSDMKTSPSGSWKGCIKEV